MPSSSRISSRASSVGVPQTAAVGCRASASARALTAAARAGRPEAAVADRDPVGRYGVRERLLDGVGRALRGVGVRAPDRAARSLPGPLVRGVADPDAARARTGDNYGQHSWDLWVREAETGRIPQ